MQSLAINSKIITLIIVVDGMYYYNDKFTLIFYPIQNRNIIKILLLQSYC